MLYTPTLTPERVYAPRAKDLSPRALQVLALLACGFSNAEIGRALDSASHTVANYVTEIYISLGVANRVSAVVVALQRGMLNLRSLAVAQRDESELRKFGISESRKADEHLGFVAYSDCSIHRDERVSPSRRARATGVHEATSRRRSQRRYCKVCVLLMTVAATSSFQPAPDPFDREKTQVIRVQQVGLVKTSPPLKPTKPGLMV
jgi:DNA-binding CsgD family transcriptional regulator